MCVWYVWGRHEEFKGFNSERNAEREETKRSTQDHGLCHVMRARASAFLLRFAVTSTGVSSSSSRIRKHILQHPSQEASHHDMR